MGESGGASGGGGILLRDHFTLRNKLQRLSLNQQALTWAPHPHTNPYERCIPLYEVVSVREEDSSNNKGCFGRRCKKSVNAAYTAAFRVYFVERAWKHRWRVRSLLFGHGDSTVVRQWLNAMTDILTGFTHRPKRLIVFINPFGGKRKSPSIYEKQVRPLFDLANIDTQVVVTQRANHARDLLQEIPLSKLDGIVCVGGDGMFSELLNGLLLRTQADHGTDFHSMRSPLHHPRLRIGVIPGGSSDAVAFSTTGINDPVTSALHIIVGDSVGVDICGIYSNSRLLRYATTLLGYGFLGDVLKDSEKHRWMGPSRYEYSGMKKFLQNRSYEGELLFRCHPPSDSTPQDNQLCITGCKVCDSAHDALKSKQFQAGIGSDNPPWERLRGKFAGINSATISCACNRTKNGLSPSAHLGDGCTDLIIISKCSRFNYLRYLLSAGGLLGNPFQLPFVRVHRVREFQFRPVSVRKELPSAPNLSHSPWEPSSSQLHLAANKGCINADYRHSDEEEDEEGSVRQQLTPAKRSVWNCDGEVVDQAAVTVRVHCQLIRLFARGVEDIPPDVSCFTFSSSAAATATLDQS